MQRNERQPTTPDRRVDGGLAGVPRRYRLRAFGITALASLGSSCLFASACTKVDHYLGYDRTITVGPSPTVVVEPRDAGIRNNGGSNGDDDDDEPQSPGRGGAGGNPPNQGGSGAEGGAGGNGANGGARSSNDGGMGEAGAFGVAGTDAGSGGMVPESGPPNQIVDVLEVPPAAVERRLEERFQQLFHGDPNGESIYVEVEGGGAYIRDIYHADTRADALGYGLLITVWLDKKTEFDAIWTFTKAFTQYTEGPRAGLFHKICPDPAEPCQNDVGVFGSINIVTALLLAEARWGNGDDIFDYGTEARSLLDIFRTLEERNTDPEEDIINIFGPDELPLREPFSEYAGQVATESLMPGYFEYWAERTGEEYWSKVADKSRELLRLIINPENGLSPSAAYFDGTLVDGDSDFREGSYMAALNMAIDTAWYGKDSEQIVLANRLVGFFAAFSGSYPSLYSYEGMPLNPNPSGALVALNGAAAGIATVPARDDFMRIVWDTPVQTGVLRYFDGVNQLISLIYLSGLARPF